MGSSIMFLARFAWIMWRSDDSLQLLERCRHMWKKKKHFEIIQGIFYMFTFVYILMPEWTGWGYGTGTSKALGTSKRVTTGTKTTTIRTTCRPCVVTCGKLTVWSGNSGRRLWVTLVTGLELKSNEICLFLKPFLCPNAVWQSLAKQRGGQWDEMEFKVPQTEFELTTQSTCTCTHYKKVNDIKYP